MLFNFDYYSQFIFYTTTLSIPLSQQTKKQRKYSKVHYYEKQENYFL